MSAHSVRASVERSTTKVAADSAHRTLCTVRSTINRTVLVARIHSFRSTFDHHRLDLALCIAASLNITVSDAFITLMVLTPAIWQTWRISPSTIYCLKLDFPGYIFVANSIGLAAVSITQLTPKLSVCVK